MIVLDDTPAIPSKVPPVTPLSSQFSKRQQLHQHNTVRSVTKLEPCAVPSRVKLAAFPVDSQFSASSDSAIASSQAVNSTGSNTTTIAGRRIIATSVLLALASVALMSIYWNTHELDGISQRLGNLISSVQSAEQQQPPLITNTDLSLTLVPNPPTASAATDDVAELTVNTPTVKELNETRQLANNYLEEVTWLQSQMSMLQQENNNLNGETTDLNRELLQLEMKVTTLESITKP